MEQPAALKTLFRLGGIRVTSSTHVVVYCSGDSGAQAAARAFSQAVGQLSGRSAPRLQLVPEATYIASRAYHASPSNDGASIRIPFVIGRCSALVQELGWEGMNHAAASKQDATASTGPDWIVRTHDVDTLTYLPECQSVATTVDLACHLFSVEAAAGQDEVVARNTMASVLWFAKELLACDIRLLGQQAEEQEKSAEQAGASSAAAHEHPHHALSPPPNAQLNVERLFVRYAFPADTPASVDLVRHTEQLPMLLEGENAQLEMAMPRILLTTAAAASAAAPTAAESSSSSFSVDTLASPTMGSVCSPSPSPSSPSPSPEPTEADLSAYPVPRAKHSRLQPIKGGRELTGRPMVACDLDEVLGEFLPCFILFHNARYATSVCLGDFFSYTFADVLGLSSDESQKRVYEFFDSPWFQEGIPVIPEARAILQRLSDQFDFVVVTSRQHAIEGLTRAWLERFYPDTFHGVLFGNHYGAKNSGLVQSKPDMCRSIHAVALIDDSLTYARQCAGVLEKVLLFDRNDTYPWNRIPTTINLAGDQAPIVPLADNVIRCHTWEAVYQQLDGWVPKQPQSMLDSAAAK